MTRVSGRVEKAVVERAAPLPPDGLLALPYKNGVLFHWEHSGPPGTSCRLRCSASPDGQVRSFTVDKTALFVESARLPAVGAAGAFYNVVVEVIDPRGHSEIRSRTLFFRLAPQADAGPDIPAESKVRILWSNINAWLGCRLL